VFVPDGDRIQTTCWEDAVELWEMFRNPQDLMERAKAQLPLRVAPERHPLLFLGLTSRGRILAICGAGRRLGTQRTRLLHTNLGTVAG
jgi:hypothetical protein